MTEQIWQTWIPQYDGHAPDDWDGSEVQTIYSERNGLELARKPKWFADCAYYYCAKQRDLLAQCLALPQADRDALIAELRKPVRDWADDVWAEACKAYGLLNNSPEKVEAAAVIRSECLSNHDPLLIDIFNFLGGVDGAAELRAKLLKVIKS